MKLEPLQSKTVILLRETYLAQKALGYEFAMEPRMEMDCLAHTAQRMLILMQDVLVQREQIAQYPSDWWQAVKQRFAPAWFLRRYPVMKTTIDMTVLYPRIAIPKERHTVTMQIVEPLQFQKQYSQWSDQ